jgi:(2R)-ethylmalonyl-CoA mutase
VDEAVEAEAIEALAAWRAARDGKAVEAALTELRTAAQEARNIMPATLQAAKVGATTGEWTQTLADVFGRWRAPTGLTLAGSPPASGQSGASLETTRERVAAAAQRLGRPVKLLVGKPGLDGHSNGAEQIALRARDAGMEVVYEGIRLTPDMIADAAIEEGVHIVGLSILSGSHGILARRVREALDTAGAQDLPVVVGGVIPPLDGDKLLNAGIAAVFTPKDYKLDDTIAAMADIAANAAFGALDTVAAE